MIASFYDWVVLNFLIKHQDLLSLINNSFILYQQIISILPKVLRDLRYFCISKIWVTRFRFVAKERILLLFCSALISRALLLRKHRMLKTCSGSIDLVFISLITVCSMAFLNFSSDFLVTSWVHCNYTTAKLQGRVSELIVRAPLEEPKLWGVLRHPLIQTNLLPLLLMPDLTLTLATQVSRMNSIFSLYTSSKLFSQDVVRFLFFQYWWFICVGVCMWTPILIKRSTAYTIVIIAGEGDVFTQSRPPSAGRRANTALPNRYFISLPYFTADCDLLLITHVRYSGVTGLY